MSFSSITEIMDIPDMTRHITRGERLIYEKVEHIYQLEDAANFADDWLSNNDDLTEEERQTIWGMIDFDYLVDRFNDKRDMEIGDWYTWTYLVQDYLVEIIDYLDGTEVTT